MKNIVITTESAADLSEEWLDLYQIKIVPFSVNFPDRTVFDNAIPVQEIYDFYEATKAIPKTNAVSPFQYTEFFEKTAAENDGAEILHIGYSSACSCSFQNALIGVADCKTAKVTLVDSKNVSGGLGTLVIKAATVKEANPEASATELAVLVEPFVKKTITAFVPNRLDFLLAGGRVSNAAAIGAAIFRIKPRIDIIEGELIAGKKYLGTMKKIIPEFVKDFMKGRNFDKERVFMFYSEGAEEKVVERLKASLYAEGFKKVEVLVLGCVMTVHGGKAAIGATAIEL